MSCPTCQHVKSDGVRCGSPALRRRTFCYFHQRLSVRHQLYRRPLPDRSTIALDAIEDRLDLHMNISQVVNAVAVGHMDAKRAAILLKGLQLASRNLKLLERGAALQRSLWLKSSLADKPAT